MFGMETHADLVSDYSRDSFKDSKWKLQYVDLVSDSV
jgi:hypothetical protein